jgi:FtsH-binding integral membrane protein
MRSVIRWRLLLLLIPSLIAAILLCATFGLGGRSWYSHPTTIVPAVAGVLLAVFAQRSNKLMALSVTLLVAWTATALLSAVSAGALVQSYNGEPETGYGYQIVRHALWAALVGGAAGVGLLLLVAKAVRPVSSREAA